MRQHDSVLLLACTYFNVKGKYDKQRLNFHQVTLFYEQKSLLSQRNMRTVASQKSILEYLSGPIVLE